MRIKFEIYEPAEPIQERTLQWPHPLPIPVAGDRVMFAERENLIVTVNHRTILLEPEADCDVVLACTASGR